MASEDLALVASNFSREILMGNRKPHPLAESFNWIATRSAEAMGSAIAFMVATLFVILWAASGPWFGYSDTWQLILSLAPEFGGDAETLKQQTLLRLPGWSRN
jgi:hypothetical protein